MEPARTAALRIFRDDTDSDVDLGARPDDTPTEAGVADPHRLAARELLRPLAVKPTHRDLDPFSRAWYEELEQKRYAPHGGWIRRVLEVSRHPGESLLMLGPGVGSDAVQYQRHGTRVTICTTASDCPAVVRRNFDLRGLPLAMQSANADGTLPFARGAFDLVYWNALNAPPADPAAAVAEVYRVLKPGGKVFALVPARYDATFWQHIFVPFRRWYRPISSLTDAPRYSSKELTRLFGSFAEHTLAKRHLRRSELPHVWRFFPLSLTERVMGRVLVMRAFKPLSAALEPLDRMPTAIDGAA